MNKPIPKLMQRTSSISPGMDTDSLIKQLYTELGNAYYTINALIEKITEIEGRLS